MTAADRQTSSRAVSAANGTQQVVVNLTVTFDKGDRPVITTDNSNATIDVMAQGQRQVMAGGSR